MAYEDLKAAQFQELNVVIDERIRTFEEFFQKLGNDPLAKPERAILRTFLIWDRIDAVTRDALVKKTAGR
jgi:hypothetical protein